MLQLNRAKFGANGNCGYVLKPECMCQGETRGPGRGAGRGSCHRLASKVGAPDMGARQRAPHYQGPAGVNEGAPLPA